VNTQSAEPIDAVYTWVNGRDAAFTQRLRSALQADPSIDPSSFHPGRFRDNGELQASLRLTFRFAPWIRQVFLVTASGPPPWLDPDDARIRMVSHEELFRGRGRLPTFNSHAIEIQLHHIEGLSRRFLYFNDDVFLGRSLSPGYFLTARDGYRIRFEHTRLPANPQCGLIHDRAYAYTQGLMTWLDPNHPQRYLPAHGPLLLDRDILLDLESRLPEAVEETTRHLFRSPQDVVLRILFLLHLMESREQSGHHESFVLKASGPEYVFLRLGRDLGYVQRMLGQIEKRPPAFYCINDDIDEPVDVNPVLQCVRKFLRRAAPGPSPVERSNAESYWDQRLDEHWGSHGTGCLAYGQKLNRWRDRGRVASFHRALRRQRLDHSRSRVLDVGTGTGLFLRQWAAEGAPHRCGVDIAPSAVRRLRSELPDVDLHQLDARDLAAAFPAAFFDAVSAMDLFFHLVEDEDYGKTLRAIGRVLKPGGVLLFSENCLPQGEHACGRYWRSRTLRQIEGLLQSANLKIIDRCPLLTLLNSPVRLPWQWPTRAWERTMLLAHHGEWVGCLLGATLYPLDRLLCRLTTGGPSTSLLVCRRLPESGGQ